MTVRVCYCREHSAPEIVAVGENASVIEHVVDDPPESAVVHTDIGIVEVEEDLEELLQKHGSAAAVHSFLGSYYSYLLT